MASSYLVYKLTGQHVKDRHTASHYMPLIDIRTLEWSPRFAADLAPLEMLPRLGWSDEQAGEISAWAAQETGLRPGTPVAVGAVDALSEAISVGATRPGDLMIMYGSTTFFILVLAEPAPDERTPLNDPNARGVVAGLNLTHTRAHLFRGVLEGVAYGVRHNLDTFASIGAKAERLVAVGGGATGNTWLQIVSDVTGRQQVVPEVTLGASYG